MAWKTVTGSLYSQPGTYGGGGNNAPSWQTYQSANPGQFGYGNNSGKIWVGDAGGFVGQWVNAPTNPNQSTAPTNPTGTGSAPPASNPGQTQPPSSPINPGSGISGTSQWGVPYTDPIGHYRTGILEGPAQQLGNLEIQNNMLPPGYYDSGWPTANGSLYGTPISNNQAQPQSPISGQPQGQDFSNFFSTYDQNPASPGGYLGQYSPASSSMAVSPAGGTGQYNPYDFSNLWNVLGQQGNQ